MAHCACIRWLLLLALLTTAQPIQAAVYCTDLAPAVQSTFTEFTPGANPQLPSTQCGTRYCTTPILNGGVQVIAQVGCDATVTTGPGCYVRANVPLQLPGNSRNPSGAHTQLFWFREGNTPPSGACIPGGPPFGISAASWPPSPKSA